ncbi:MAG: hypothetical protein HGA38_05725, partial [Candidatus Moranbacteria bacterium]|nr:hypothetical protein [Candidatus Moranbacteria bacterium]
MNHIERSYSLPNKPTLTAEKFDETKDRLEASYIEALELEFVRNEIQSDVNRVLRKPTIDSINKILEKAPQEAAPELAGNLRYLPEGIREEIARLLLE